MKFLQFKTKKNLICPNCSKYISYDRLECPYCGKNIHPIIIGDTIGDIYKDIGIKFKKYSFTEILFFMILEKIFSFGFMQTILSNIYLLKHNKSQKKD